MESEASTDSKQEEIDLLSELRTLVKGNYQLKRLSSDDDYLKRFLYICNLDVPKAYERMKEFCYLLLEFPDWFAISLEKNKPALEEEATVVVPIEDKEGRPVLMMKVCNVQPDRVELLDMVYVQQVWVEHLFNETNFSLQKNGLCVIIDVKDIPWGVVKWFTPYNITTSLKLIERYPIKHYRFHVVNTSTVLSTILKILWPFLSESIREMIIFHYKDYEKLQEYINLEALPSEYGGTRETSFSECYKILLDQKDKIERNLRKYFGSYII